MPDVRTIVPETVVVTACPSVGVANDAAPDRDRRVHGGRRRPSRCRSPGQAAPLDEHTPSCSAAAALPVAVHGPGAPVGSGGAVSIDTRRPTGLGRRRPRTVGARGQGGTRRGGTVERQLPRCRLRRGRHGRCRVVGIHDGAMGSEYGDDGPERSWAQAAYDDFNAPPSRAFYTWTHPAGRLRPLLTTGRRRSDPR